MNDRNLYIDRWKKVKNIKLDLKKLTRDQFIDEVSNINRLLRNLDSTAEVFSEHVEFGDQMPPTKEVKKNIIDALLSYAKKEKDPLKLATITYYIMIDLHLFGDGNGRTSRFLYDCIIGDLNESNYMYYFHKNGDNGHFSGKDDFGNFKGFLDSCYFRDYANALFENDLKPYLNQYDYLQDKAISFRTHFDACADGKFDEIKEEMSNRFDLGDLTEKEIFDLSRVLLDGCSSVTFEIAGIAVMIRAIERGEFDKWIEEDKKFRKLVDDDFFDNIMSMFISNELLESWNAEDWRKVIEYGTFYKEKQLRYMIDIFENPCKYIVDGRPFLENVMKTNIIEQTNAM